MKGGGRGASAGCPTTLLFGVSSSLTSLKVVLACWGRPDVVSGDSIISASGWEEARHKMVDGGGCTTGGLPIVNCREGLGFLSSKQPGISSERCTAEGDGCGCWGASKDISVSAGVSGTRDRGGVTGGEVKGGGDGRATLVGPFSALSQGTPSSSTWFSPCPWSWSKRSGIDWHQQNSGR